MKLIKYLVCGVLMAGSLSVLTSCEDDDNLGQAPRLFSPVVGVTTSSNSLICKWQGIKGANNYKLTLLKETSLLDEAGEPVYQEVKVVDTPASPYTFEGLDWDDRYRVDIQAIGDGIESHVYQGEAVTISYPTKLKSVANVIDTGVRIEWNEDKSVAAWTDVAYMNVYTRNADGSVTLYQPGDAMAQSRADEVEKDPIVAPEENDNYYYTLTEEDIRNSYCNIYGLDAATDYRVVAYNAEGEYRGRRDFTTKEAEVYENPDVVRDLRTEAVDTLKQDLIDELPDGAVVVLTGGKQYVCNGTIKYKKSIKFTTGMSLEGKAILLSPGFGVDGAVNRIEFNDVIITCLPNDNKSSNFGGRYVFGDATVYDINEIVFENTDIKCERGIMRVRTAGQKINSVVMNNCTMDSIGGYGICQLDASNVSVGSFTITNSTITNAERVLRCAKDNSGYTNILVENVTFAYVSNNCSYFDMGSKESQNPNLTLEMKNCIIGPGFDGKMIQGFNCKQGLASFTNLYATSDAEMSVDDVGNLKNPFGSYEVMSQSSKDIWENPENHDFTLKSASLPCAAAGDPRWHVK